MTRAASDLAHELTGKPWLDMDYGPFLTASIDCGQPRTNLAYKGIAIRVGDAFGGGQNEAVVFDTDLLRYAAGWTGDFVALKGVVFDGEHWAYPQIAGLQAFGNPMLPGWAKGGSFRDPRAHPFGPLPRDWARWRGLHLHGRRVLLDYTVGDAGVLEMPGVERLGEQTAFSRTFNRSATTDTQDLQLAFDAGGRGVLLSLADLRPFGDAPDATRVIAVLEPAAVPAPAARGPALSREGGLIGRWEFERFEGERALSEIPGSGALALSGAKRTANGRDGAGLAFDGKSLAEWTGGPGVEFLLSDFTLAAWIRTAHDGTILAQAPSSGNWVPDGKSLFIRGGRLSFDIGWVGAVSSGGSVADGNWHHVAMTWSLGDGAVALFVDGEPDGAGSLKPRRHVEGHGIRLGFTAPNFPESPWFDGTVDSLRLYSRALEAGEIAALAGVEPRDDVLALAVVGAAAGARWLTAEEGHVRLRLPPAAAASRFKVLIWRGPRDGLKGFAELVRQSKPPEDLEPFTRGGPPRWPEKLITRGELGRGEGPYAIDTLTSPDENPWHSWLRFGGLDLFPDGKRAALCTWNGDVWLVDGVDGDLTRLGWQRIATGLFQPLGVKVVEDQIYVLGRDQITRLHDRNGDGEADWYENFNNDCMVSEHFHEFALDLKTDRDGNFYYLKCARHALPALHPHHGTLLKLPPDGSKLEVVARGFRAVNGLGVGPHGELTSVDNQGHWMPANRINWIKPGGWYGNQWAWNPEGRTTYDEPLCWMHNFVDRSGGTHLWVPDNRWGPLQDQMLTISYGMGHMFLVLTEEVEGRKQGGVTRLPVEFETGVMRGLFHPGNGQLYTAGLYGWAGNKTRAGGFYRMRYTGDPLHLPNALRVASDGVVIGFTDPLDPASATDPGNYDVTMWNYHWTATYGSPDLKLNGQEGRDRLAVDSATLSADRRLVFLKLPKIQRVMQMHIVFKLRGADGKPVENFIHNTVHRLGSVPGLDLLGPGAFTHTGTALVALTDPRPGLAQEIASLAGNRETPHAQTPDTRRARLPALHVPKETPPTPFVASGRFRSTWSGYLQLELNDERTFQLEGSGVARLRINGETVLDVASSNFAGNASAAVSLRGGPNRLELDYESSSTGEGTLRLLWAAPGEHPEPIPPTAYVHEAGDPALRRGEARREGRNLFLRHQCAKCHRPDESMLSRAVPELTQEGPVLDDVSSRLHPGWLQQYLADPASTRDDVLMPRVLINAPEQVRADARDIVAFLASLQPGRTTGVGEAEASPIPQAIPESEGRLEADEKIAAGKGRFETFGCGACHVLAGEARLTDDTRISLAHVPAKWKTAGLARFLDKPARDHAWTRMPDFALTQDEAAMLAAFLGAQVAEPMLADDGGLSGDVARGRALIESSGCVNCHTLSGVTTTLEAPSLEDLARSDWRRGCVTDAGAPRGRAPDFGFTADTRRNLRAFAALEWLPSLERETPTEFAERHVANLRCDACHARDGEPDFLSRLTSARTPPVKNPYEDEEEGGAGSVHLGRPELTIAGEKLHGEWMQRLLEGRLQYKARPEAQGRMPAFPAVGRQLGAGLAHQHGLDARAVTRPAADPDQAAFGQRLTLIEGGFGCVSCHGVGRQEALAGPDTATINFAFVADRLRLDYFQRYVRDPQQFRPGTMMPSFIAEDGSTPIKGVLDGDAARQFDTIWQYLLSLDPGMAAP